MLLKYAALLLLLIILYCLSSGLFYLIRDGIATKRLAWALTWRSALSIMLFALLLIGYNLGWIMPHGLMDY